MTSCMVVYGCILREWVVLRCWRDDSGATYHVGIRSSGDPAAKHVCLHLDRRCREHAQASNFCREGRGL